MRHAVLIFLLKIGFYWCNIVLRICIGVYLENTQKIYKGGKNEVSIYML